MKRRVRASTLTRKRLEDLFAGRTAGDKSVLVKLAAQLILEEALEAEVDDALGRGYYEHRGPSRSSQWVSARCAGEW